MPEFPQPINPQSLCDENYRIAAMLPIFASGMSPYAGQAVDPTLWCMAGMRKVFDWMCKNGVACGEAQMIDAAADVAYEIAAMVYPDADTLSAAFEQIMPYMLKQVESCSGTQGRFTSHPAP